MSRVQQRFFGRIAGIGSTSGTRVVVGRWERTPMGAFADAMVETAAGHRVLLAPTEEVADFIAATYSFDETRVEPFEASVTGATWEVRSPSLELTLVTGSRTALGHLLRVVPPPLARDPRWATLVDPVARVALRGVRTRGAARDGRREFYGASDVHRVTRAQGSFDGIPLGELAPVDPPCRFGFSSTPRTPSVTDVVTTVELRAATAGY
ncbi:MAG TPA: hypothetical protein VES95_00570 [Dermatophilaceae bacterium]|nr:hypothetical protein [Dermatophilaceae bacterium]